jgi:hypothetical protein
LRKKTKIKIEFHPRSHAQHCVPPQLFASLTNSAQLKKRKNQTDEFRELKSFLKKNIFFTREDVVIV